MAGDRCEACGRLCFGPGEGRGAPGQSALFFRYWRMAGHTDQDHANGLLDYAMEALWADLQATPVRYVLTTAHLDPDPMNVAPDNLVALCSVCHLRMDARRKAVERRTPPDHPALLDVDAEPDPLVEQVRKLATLDRRVRRLAVKLTQPVSPPAGENRDPLLVTLEELDAVAFQLRRLREEWTNGQ